MLYVLEFFFFQAEDGIRYLVRSRGLGDVYKRQVQVQCRHRLDQGQDGDAAAARGRREGEDRAELQPCLLYTSDAADERSSVDLGGRRIIKKKNIEDYTEHRIYTQTKNR